MCTVPLTTSTRAFGIYDCHPASGTVGHKRFGVESENESAIITIHLNQVVIESNDTYGMRP